MSMLTDIYYKKTERCNKYPAMLATKNVPQMPLLTVKADEFDSQWILKHALEEPVLLVGSNEDMGITLLDRDVKLSQVATLLGPNTPVKIIEVGLQSEITGKTFAEYATYLEKRGPKHKVLNLISLEISATPLTAHIEAPRFVREEVDWIDSIWPLERRARGGDYPQVQKYLLTGMAGSYTDFHIDFGGTSVWYSVVWGRKRFYFIPPTPANLKMYEAWTCSPTQENDFLGDLVAEARPAGADSSAHFTKQQQCFYVDLVPGQTLIIPGGWIHAVFTPEDSLVFGGNFLLSHCILRQLQVHDIEMRTHVAKQYRFPYFKDISWYALCDLLPLVKQYAIEKLGPAALTDVVLSNTNGEVRDGIDTEDSAISINAAVSMLVARQLPYLVKACEGWLDSASLMESKEFNTFSDAAVSMAGVESAAQVISDWWHILTVHYDALIVDNSDTGSGSKYRSVSFRSHVDRVMSSQKLELFDDAVYTDVFPIPVPIDDPNRQAVTAIPAGLGIKLESSGDGAAADVDADVAPGPSMKKFKFTISGTPIGTEAIHGPPNDSGDMPVPKSRTKGPVGGSVGSRSLLGYHGQDEEDTTDNYARTYGATSVRGSSSDDPVADAAKAGKQYATRDKKLSSSFLKAVYGHADTLAPAEVSGFVPADEDDPFAVTDSQKMVNPNLSADVADGYDDWAADQEQVEEVEDEKDAYEEPAGAADGQESAEESDDDVDEGIEESEGEAGSEPSESEPDSEDQVDPYADESDEESEDERPRPKKRPAALMAGYRPSGSISTGGRAIPQSFSVSQAGNIGAAGNNRAPAGAFSISQASHYASAGGNAQLSVRQQLMKKMGQGPPRR